MSKVLAHLLYPSVILFVMIKYRIYPFGYCIVIIQKGLFF
jgi:hypothetical protein